MYNLLQKRIWNSLTVKLEASTLCQLKCSTCYMRRDNWGGVGKGYLSYANFVSFLKTHPLIKNIELSNNGEIFLNPDLPDIVKYSYDTNVLLYAINGVNFNTCSAELLDNMVKYKFNCISVSIDGASPSTYSQKPDQ